MGRFATNPALAAGAVRAADTTNAAGGRAYANDPKTSLAIQLVSSFASGDHYRDEAAQLKGLLDAVQKVPDLQWVAKAAIYARDVMGMRTTSHFVTACIAVLGHGQPWLRKFYQRVVLRPDDMCEVLGAYWMLKGHTGKGKTAVPNALKRGFADRFAQLTGYALAKYRGGGRAVKLIDVARLVHAKGDLVTQLCKGTLPPAETWEVGISGAGDAAARTKVWGDLLRTGKLGYMATMRNLRNIAKDAPDHLAAALEVIRDTERMRKARVFPFRLFTAYRLFETTEGAEGLTRAQIREIHEALSVALDASTTTVPKFEGDSLVVIDTSGSMESTVSQKSSVRCVEAAAVMGATVRRQNPKCDMAIFADTSKYITTGPAARPVVDVVAGVLGKIGDVGHGTNMSSIFGLIDLAQFRRIFVMSDMQSWYGDETAATNWLNRNPKNHLYVWNLHGDGSTLAAPENKRVIQLGGFSDRIWDTIPMLEQGPAGLVQAIDAWDPWAKKAADAAEDPGADPVS
jgi:hypothetical protein